MSAGRSMATDLPMPSGMKCEVASLAATCRADTRVSAAGAGTTGARPETAIRAASPAVRINDLFAMSRFPLGRSLRCRRRAYAKTDHVDAVSAAMLVDRRRLVFLGVGDTAQCQRQCSELTRERECFRLRRRELKGR